MEQYNKRENCKFCGGKKTVYTKHGDSVRYCHNLIMRTGDINPSICGRSPSHLLKNGKAIPTHCRKCGSTDLRVKKLKGKSIITGECNRCYNEYQRNYRLSMKEKQNKAA